MYVGYHGEKNENNGIVLKKGTFITMRFVFLNPPKSRRKKMLNNMPSNYNKNIRASLYVCNMHKAHSWLGNFKQCVMLQKQVKHFLNF